MKEMMVDEYENMPMAEISARVPYLLAYNAKNTLRRDNFLVSFLPRTTETALKSAGLKSLDEFHKKLRRNTRLLGEVAEASYNEFKDQWEQEVDNAEVYKAKAESLLGIMEVRSAIESNKMRSDAAFVKMKLEDLNGLVEMQKKLPDQIQEQKAWLENEAKKNEADRDKKQIRKRYDLFKQLAATLPKVDKAIGSYQSLLTALGEFSWTESAKREEGELPPPNNFMGYIISTLSNEKSKIQSLLGYYEQKYGCRPEYLAAYDELLEELSDHALNSNFDLVHAREIMETRINQYIDILKYAPGIIINTAKKYPQLQGEMNEAEDAWISGEYLPESMGATIAEGANKPNTTEEGELESYAEKHRFRSFRMVNILGSADSRVGMQQDRQVMILNGEPGTAKTAAVEAMAKEINMYFKSLSIPHIDSTTLGGFPMINSNDEAGQFISSDMAASVRKFGIIDFEEANAFIDPTIGNQLARFLQVGELSQGLKLHPLSIIVMTANDNPRDNPNINEFSKAVTSRIQSIYLNNRARQLSDWACWVKKHYDPDKMYAFNIILSFLTRDDTGKSLWIDKTAKSKDGKDVEPNFRTWYNLAEHLNSIISNKAYSIYENKADIVRAAQPFVGPKAAKALASHYTVVAKMPSIDDMLKRVEESNLKPLDAIRIYGMENAQSIVIDPETKEYKLASDPHVDREIVEASNAYAKQINRPDLVRDVSSLLKDSELTKKFNYIWKSKDDDFDINQGAVLFHLSSQIEGRLNELFIKSKDRKEPVSGTDIDNLLTLAMTLPVTNTRSSLVIKLTNALTYNEKLDVLSRYGIAYKRNSDDRLDIKRYAKDYDPSSSDPKKNTLKEPKETSKYRIVYTPRSVMSLVHNLLYQCSRSYRRSIGVEDKTNLFSASPMGAER